MSDYRMREPDESNEPTNSRTLDPQAGRKWAIGGLVCAVLALPIPILGIVGMILGFVARSKGAGRLALAAIVLSVVLAIAGFVGGLLLTGLATAAAAPAAHGA